MELYICSKCGFESTPDKFHTKTNCKKCHSDYNNKWQKKNPDKIRKYAARRYQESDHTSMSENKECSAYLGVYVAERVLSRVFENVEKQPLGNPGYDFICNKGKKIDVKSACSQIGKRCVNKHWSFHTEKNKIPDYFLCLAFDNREDLNPLHLWLMPADVVNNSARAYITTSTLNKWNKYALDIEKVSTCCDMMRG